MPWATALSLTHTRTWIAISHLSEVRRINSENRSSFLALAQDHSDMDVALIKYRVAAVHTPNSAQLWNKCADVDVLVCILLNE